MVETGRQMVNQLEADRTNTLLPSLGFILRSWYLSLQVMALVSVHTSTLSFPWETQYNSLGNFRDLNIKSSAKGLYGPHGMCDWPARPSMSPKDRDLPATGWLVGRSWFAILKGSPDRNEYMKITWKYMKMNTWKWFKCIFKTFEMTYLPRGGNTVMWRSTRGITQMITVLKHTDYAELMFSAVS